MFFQALFAKTNFKIFSYARDLYPVGTIRARHESLHVVTTSVIRRSFVDSLWWPFQHTNRDVPVQEWDPLQEEPPRRLDSATVRAPMFHTIIDVFLEDVESLAAGNVQKHLFLDFLEYPRFYQCTSSNSAALNARALLAHSLVVRVWQYIAVSKHWDWISCFCTPLYVLPIGQFWVTLFPRSPMNLNKI